MNRDTWLGPADAEAVVLAKGGRDFRYRRLANGEETPREFFYGYLDLAEKMPAAMLSTSGREPGVLGLAADGLERAFAALTALGVRPLSVRLASPALARAKVLISFTDGFSLSLGLGFPGRGDGPVRIGGFHGLSDIEERAPERFRSLVRRVIARSLAGLDHIFFFGPMDRSVSIARYGVPESKTSLFRFGVDTAFWRPVETERRDVVVAVGQDGNRDFDLLARAPGGHPTRIVTRRTVNVPADASHVTVTAGDFFNSDSLTDEEIRSLYNMAAAVIVPLKDVNQPTGYSVTLQAMSCGRPVVLSRIRGLWTPDLLVEGENCLLVPPGDAAALGSAIGRLRSDPGLATRIGRAARATVERHFPLSVVGAGTIALAERGFATRLSRGVAA